MTNTDLDKVESNYSKILMLVMVTMIFTFIGTGVLINSYADSDNANPIKSNTSNPTLENAYWKIRQVTPSPTKPGVVKLDLKSSVGNLRAYDEVKAYGISNSGKYLAITTANGVEIVDLSNNTNQVINTPFGLTGDSGQTISWSHNDAYIAIPVFNAQDNSPHLLVFSQNGTVTKDSVINLAYRSENNNISFYPVLFSPTANNEILTRQFNDTDTSTSTVAAKAVIMAVVDLDGNTLWEMDARAAGDTNEVIYTWSRDGKYLHYNLVSPTTIINYANQNLFKQVLIER